MKLKEKKKFQHINRRYKEKPETSSLDGGMGRYTLLPCTTKRRTTTNLKTKITGIARKSNCMKVRQPKS